MVNASDLNLDSYSLSFENIYLNEKYMYYQNYVNKERCICRFDLKEQRIINEFPINSLSNIDTFFADGDTVFLVEDLNSLYKINLSENIIEKTFECTGTLTVNLYNEKLYAGVQRDDDNDGVYIIDYQGNKIRISDKETYGVYILDEQYVYYCDRDFNLYRTTTDGQKTEKVF